MPLYIYISKITFWDLFNGTESSSLIVSTGISLIPLTLWDIMKTCSACNFSICLSSMSMKELLFFSSSPPSISSSSRILYLEEAPVRIANDKAIEINAISD